MDPGLRAPPPPALDRCGACGQASDAPERCPHCGSSLLVDVLLDPPLAEPRLVYGAARAAAAARVPGLDFAAARGALSRPGAPLAVAVRRDAARVLVAALAEAKLAAVVRATAPGATARRGIPPAAVAGVALAALVLIAAGLLAVRSRTGPTASPPPAAEATAPAPAPAPAAQAPGGAAAPAPPRDLSVEELARLARPALAVLTCGGRLGSGFFVDPERLLTNAHVTCGTAATIDVKLADGRRLAGSVRVLDEWLDYAVVDVPGARAAPLPLGDSTTLAAGAPVVLVGTPVGLEATVHAGKVSFAARNLQGVAHVQLNADVNPGNSGGPVLDSQGRVVGIVTLKQQGADGVGFALPVEYARDALQAPIRDEGQRGRWGATVSRVERDDDAEAQRLLGRLEKPLLAGVGAAGRKLAILVLRRWASSAPWPEPVTVEVRDGAKVLCEASGVASDWKSVEEKYREASAQDRATRTARWMLRRKIAAGTWAGVALLDIASCPEETSQWTVVALRGDAEETFAYPARELAEGRRAAAARAEAAAEMEEANRAGQEADWRLAFQTLRERVAKLEEERRSLRGAMERQMADTQMLERVKRLEGELDRRRAELEDLERRASLQGIPREWRQ